MSDDVGKFCVSVHEKLETLQGRMDALRSNIGTTWHSLQEKLDDVRRLREAKKVTIATTRARLEQWCQENASEAKGMIDRWVQNGEIHKLTARAQQAEEFAWLAIVLAEASIDDVERMVLEAVSARRAADAVTMDDAESRR